MSDFRAIGDVSATLQALLRDRMELPPNVTNVQVTVGTPRPEREDGQATEDPRINLFLYRVTENGALKNQEIPGHGHPSSYGQPPLSLDLHYLLTAYGTTADGEFVNETRAHYVLGSAMRVLHDHPVITERLKKARELPIGDPILHQGLRGEFERVKLYLEPISLEDLSKVWTALTLPYRLSVAYMVTVVQIESRRPKRIALPVLDLPRDEAPRVHMVPFQHPQITDVSPMLARIGDKLTIRGANFASAVRVKIGHLRLPVTPLPDGSIELTIPQDKYPDNSPIDEKDRLRAGPQTVQVVTAVTTLPGKHLRSNLAVFMLVPNITAVNPTSGTAGDTITVNFTPDFRRGDRAYLFVGDRGLEAQQLPNNVKSSDELKFELPTASDERIPARTEPYPLRLRINGAESRYELVGTPPKPKWTLRVT